MPRFVIPSLISKKEAASREKRKKTILSFMKPQMKLWRFPCIYAKVFVFASISYSNWAATSCLLLALFELASKPFLHCVPPRWPTLLLQVRESRMPTVEVIGFKTSIDQKWEDILKWDLKLDEIRTINNYALLVGYVSMSMRGLGFLVVTWTTVVLLGGFVSMLQKKDFWCLTLITLIHTAGVFDIFVIEKLSSLWRTAPGWVVVMSCALSKTKSIPGLAGYCIRYLLGIVALVHLLVALFVGFPLETVYNLGPLISAGLSLWRLTEQDYGADGDATANLRPSLYVLYSLALLQGVLFSYKFIFGLCESRIVGQVATRYGDQECSLLMHYLRATVTGCEKDPSFATGRNLITYAVDLMESKSPADYISGTCALDTLIQRQKKFIKDSSMRPELIEQNMLMKHLIIVSAPTSNILQKLLQTLDLRSQYSQETRLCAARIVAHLAGNIRLEKFPWGIQCISSLIHTVDEYRLLEAHEEDWYKHARHLPSSVTEASESAGLIKRIKTAFNEAHEMVDEEGWYPLPKIHVTKSYPELLLEGLRILRKLAADENNCRLMSNTKGLFSKIVGPATSDLPLHIEHSTRSSIVQKSLEVMHQLAVDENNCRLMSNTKGLLSKIMAPVTSDLLHHFEHGAWSGIVQKSLEVMHQLTSAPGETGAKLRHEISSTKEAIATMERILKCEQCGRELQKRAMEILTQLCTDTESREIFIKMLVDIFADDNKYLSIRKLAGEALSMLSFQGQSNTNIILQVNGDVVGSLTKILLDVKNNTCRISAAEILEHLCLYTKDEKCLKKLKVISDTMPKVLGEILDCELTRKKKHTLKEADKVMFFRLGAGTDIENQCDNTEDNGWGKGSSSSHLQKNEQDEDEEFHAVLLSLCVTICDTLISDDEDLSCQLPEINEFSFPMALKEMVVKKSGSAFTACCLRIMKLTSMIVISMMKHRGNYIEQDLKSLMNSLSSVSDSVLLLDGSMVLASSNHGATAMKPFSSLASLVEEANELVDKKWPVAIMLRRR